VADTGIIVRPGDVEGIAAAWDRILQLPREERGRLAESARDRMVKNFGLEAAATRYAALYR
jgi:glycosyltransferase involved in cell wall biosynthesis